MSPVRGRRALAFAVIACACLLQGCVERRYTIRSNPPGALAIVNDEEIGSTPVSRSFTYYGARKVTLVADGYQTETFTQKMPAPWWDNLVTEFFTENLIPFQLRDDRTYDFQLKPVQGTEPEGVAKRAEHYRAEGRSQTPRKPPRFWSWFGFGD